MTTQSHNVAPLLEPRYNEVQAIRAAIGREVARMVQVSNALVVSRRLKEEADRAYRIAVQDAAFEALKAHDMGPLDAPRRVGGFEEVEG